MRPDGPYWIAFSLLPGSGRSACAAWPTPSAIWSGLAGLCGLRRRGPGAARGAGAPSRRGPRSTSRQHWRVSRAGATAHTLADPTYPARLAEIYDAPPVLYTRGAFAPEDEWAVAVVGTRNVSSYGREVTHRLVTDLARRNVTIVSGLARGVDGLAHRAALEAGGRTIAVFACGVDVIYPSEHRRLAEDIA